MLYLAIDQHRKQLTVNLRNEQGDVLLKRQVSTEWPRVRSFLEEVRKRGLVEGGEATILEVCGFNDWLLKLLAEYGFREIVLVQPEQRSKNKTDRRDANALGELLWTNRQRLLAGKKVQNVRRIVPPSDRDAEDRQLTALRMRSGRLRTRTINQVQHLLLKRNLQQECPTKGLKAKRARKWLANLPLGKIDRLEMDQLLVQWELWDRQVLELETKIRQRQRENPTAAIVATVPGAGAYGSLALACRIGSIERFPHARSLAHYWGLTPRSRNSGDATQRLGSITKQGSAPARFFLAQMVMHVLRRDPFLKDWYRRIKRRRGAKIARVAVMRRLATILWHLIKYRQAYQPGGGRQGKDGRLIVEPRRIEAGVFLGMTGQMNEKKKQGIKKAPAAETAEADGSFTRPGLAIPRRVARQQRPIPFRQTKPI
jgi:transposase